MITREDIPKVLASFLEENRMLHKFQEKVNQSTVQFEYWKSLPLEYLLTTAFIFPEDEAIEWIKLNLKWIEYLKEKGYETCC
jgi:phosphoribosylaminoimidazole carboxylase (NCAIR synthetase)